MLGGEWLPEPMDYLDQADLDRASAERPTPDELEEDRRLMRCSSGDAHLQLPGL